jgi:hypothetical protein
LLAFHKELLEKKLTRIKRYELIVLSKRLDIQITPGDWGHFLL